MSERATHGPWGPGPCGPWSHLVEDGTWYEVYTREQAGGPRILLCWRTCASCADKKCKQYAQKYGNAGRVNVNKDPMLRLIGG